MKRVISGKGDLRRVGAGDRNLKRAGVLVFTVSILAVAAAPTGLEAQDQAGKTQTAKSNGAGNQTPEPLLTIAGKQKVNSENVAELREIAWDELTFFLTASNPLKRQMALLPLSVLTNDPKALNLMTKMLAEDKEEDVRVQAAVVLGDAKIKPAIPALRAALDDSKGPVAFAAAKSLWELDDASGMPMFRQILLGKRKGGDGMMGGQVQDAKRVMHDPKALAILTANTATGVLLGPAVLGLKFAEQGMTDSGSVLRAYSARMVGKDKSEGASQVLYDGLKDSNGVVRAAVCKAFALRDETGALGAIRDTMLDKSVPARVMASAAVLRLTERPLPEGALKRTAHPASTPPPGPPKSR